MGVGGGGGCVCAWYSVWLMKLLIDPTTHDGSDNLNNNNVHLSCAHQRPERSDGSNNSYGFNL